MFRKKKESLIKKIIFNQLFITTVGLVLIALISVPLIRHIRQRQIIDNEISQLQGNVDELQKKNNDLKNMISYLKSDQFAEEQARMQLGFKKDGEEVVIVKDKNADSVDNSGTINKNGLFDAPITAKNTVVLSNPQRWWLYFFEPGSDKGKEQGS